MPDDICASQIKMHTRRYHHQGVAPLRMHHQGIEMTRPVGDQSGHSSNSADGSEGVSSSPENGATEC